MNKDLRHMYIAVLKRNRWIENRGDYKFAFGLRHDPSLNIPRYRTQLLDRLLVLKPRELK